MSKSSKRPMKSWFNAKNAAAYRRQRNREYTTQHEAAVQESREKRLIDQLREMADRTPPICQYDKPEKTMIFGKEITVYCKPFEQFQELLRRAADALDVDAVEVVRCKDCRWAREKDHREPTDTPRELICECFKHHYIPASWGAIMAVSPDDFCSYGERKTDG